MNTNAAPLPPFGPEVFAARRDKVRARMSELGLSALYVTSAPNRFYLSGFELHDPQCDESSGALVITAKGDDYLLTDPRFTDAAKRLWAEDRLIIYSRERHKTVGTFLAGLVTGPVHFEPRYLSVENAAKLSPYVQLAPSEHRLVEDLRAIKEPAEIERIRRSTALTRQVIEAVPTLVSPGMCESEAAWVIEKTCRDQGAQEMAFATILAVGPNGALPHAVPCGVLLSEHDSLLVDMGVRLHDYCSDQTRTFWLGERAPDHFRSTLELVQKAQARAIDGIRAGVHAAEAYALAWKFFQENGVESAFTHGLGHGVGLQTHEAPSLSPAGNDVLKPGMVVTVEPGLYYPEWGGVRWEHMVLVTEDGCEIL